MEESNMIYVGDDNCQNELLHALMRLPNEMTTIGGVMVEQFDYDYSKRACVYGSGDGIGLIKPEEAECAIYALEYYKDEILKFERNSLIRCLDGGGITQKEYDKRYDHYTDLINYCNEAIDNIKMGMNWR